MPDLSRLPLWSEVAILAMAAAVVWYAGSRLAVTADALRRRLGAGRGLSGMVLLGAMSSLPEMSSVATGAASGNAPLAVNNLIGSLSFNLVVIAIADATVRGPALSARIAEAGALHQALLNIIALGLTLAVVVTGDVVVWRAGLGTILISVFAVAAYWLASGFARRTLWQLRSVVEEANPGSGRSGADEEPSPADIPLRSTLLKMAALVIAIVGSGFLLATSAEAVAKSIGLPMTLAGLVLLGPVTSLPEMATATAAVRLGQFDMAVADIFGTNLFDLGLLVVADLFYGKGAVLDTGGKFATGALVLCLLLTAIYGVGLLERRERTVWRTGIDSWIVLAVYAIGVAFLALVFRT